MAAASADPDEVKASLAPSATQPTAAQRVLSIAELLEQILLELDHVAPFDLQRVSTRFRDIIAGSSVLQDRMLKPRFSFRETVLDGESQIFSELELHPKIRQAMEPFKTTSITHMEGDTEAIMDANMNALWCHKIMADDIWAPKLGAKCEDVDASWNQIVLHKEGSKLKLWVHIPLHGLYTVAPAEQCTLRELVEKCWRCLEAAMFFKKRDSKSGSKEEKEEEEAEEEEN
ncbi:hypothetical protein Slin14017_G126090 [Septoria linicola]|nr:hypothetical protein Slin14017_G126090 [Septoria linicola]